MQYPQLVIYERDGQIAELLRLLAHDRRWSLRESRQPESCIRLLRSGRPGLLVIKVEKDLEKPLQLVEQCHWLCPEARSIVVGSEPNPLLATLAWDLGASYVLTPPQSQDDLPGLVAGFLKEPFLNLPTPPDANR